MTDFSKVAKVKYENQVFDVLDVINIKPSPNETRGKTQFVTLIDDYFIFNSEDGCFFVKNTVNKTENPITEDILSVSGVDDYGFKVNFEVKKDLESKVWHYIKFIQNGAEFNLEGERILLSQLDLY